MLTAVSLSLLAWASGCAEDDAVTTEAQATPIPLSTSEWQPGDNAFEGAIDGRVRLSADGCIYLTSGAASGKANLVWPKGYTAETGADGEWAVRNPAGQVVAREGTHLVAGGGGFSVSEGGEAEYAALDLVCEVPGGQAAVIQSVVEPLSP